MPDNIRKALDAKQRWIEDVIVESNCNALAIT